MRRPWEGSVDDAPETRPRRPNPLPKDPPPGFGIPEWGGPDAPLPDIRSPGNPLPKDPPPGFGIPERGGPDAPLPDIRSPGNPLPKDPPPGFGVPERRGWLRRGRR